MNPNHETTIEILNQKLAMANLEAAQWQSVASDLHKENEQYKQESEHLNEQINELTKTNNERYEPNETEAVNLPHEVTKAK